MSEINYSQCFRDTVSWQSIPKSNCVCYSSTRTDTGSSVHLLYRLMSQSSGIIVGNILCDFRLRRYPVGSRICRSLCTPARLQRRLDSTPAATLQSRRRRQLPICKYTTTTVQIHNINKLENVIFTKHWKFDPAVAALAPAGRTLYLPSPSKCTSHYIKKQRQNLAKIYNGWKCGIKTFKYVTFIFVKSLQF